MKKMRLLADRAICCSNPMHGDTSLAPICRRGSASLPWPWAAPVRQLLDIAPVVFATPHFAIKGIPYSPIGAIAHLGLEIRLIHPVAPEEGGKL
jgi:hypothetical protein